MLPTLNPAPWRRITGLSPSIVSKIYRETVAQRKLFVRNHTSIFLKKRSPSFYKIGEEWKENSLKNLGGEKTQSPQYRLLLPTLFCVFVCYTSSLGFLPGLSNTGERTQHLPNIFAKLRKGLTESD